MAMERNTGTSYSVPTPSPPAIDPKGRAMPVCVCGSGGWGEGGRELGMEWVRKGGSGTAHPEIDQRRGGLYQDMGGDHAHTHTVFGIQLSA